MKSAPQAALLDGMDQHSHPDICVQPFFFFFCSGWWRLHTFFVYATIYLKASVALSFLYKPEEDVSKLFNASGLWNVKFLQRTRVGFPRQSKGCDRMRVLIASPRLGASLHSTNEEQR